MSKAKQTVPRAALRQLLTRAEAARLLAVSPATLSRWAAERQGPPFVKLGSASKAAVRYPADALEEFIAAHTRHEKPEGAAS